MMTSLNIWELPKSKVCIDEYGKYSHANVDVDHDYDYNNCGDDKGALLKDISSLISFTLSPKCV